MFPLQKRDAFSVRKERPSVISVPLPGDRLFDEVLVFTQRCQARHAQEEEENPWLLSCHLH